MSRPQFSLGCAFWLVTAMAIIVGASRAAGAGAGLPTFGVFFAAIIWAGELGRFPHLGESVAGHTLFGRLPLAPFS